MPNLVVINGGKQATRMPTHADVMRSLKEGDLRGALDAMLERADLTTSRLTPLERKRALRIAGGRDDA